MTRLKIDDANCAAIAAIAAELGLSQTKALNVLLSDLAGDYLDHIRSRPRPRLVPNAIQTGSKVDPTRLSVEPTTGSNVVPIHAHPAPDRDPLLDRLGSLLEQW